MQLRRLILIIVTAGSLSLQAQVRLPSVFSDHAVLQRDKPIHIWGYSAAAENITLAFHNQSVKTHADSNGMWETWLNPESAGGPYTLEVNGDASAPIRRTDILVGDVWIASGQSNMEFPMKGFGKALPLLNGTQEIAAASQPMVRLLLVHTRTMPTSQRQSNDSWTQCTPDTAKDFSAVAYFFGRDLATKEHVPIGLIDATWGGTPAEAWVSPAGLAYANVASVFENEGRYARTQGQADEIRSLQDFDDAALREAGKPVPVRSKIPGDHAGSWTPGGLYNGMISPYTRYTIKGAIWYQGETDAADPNAGSYARIFSALIEDWRRQWNQGTFPFLFVQLSSYGNDIHWGQVRDAQRQTLDLINTAMAVTLDVGETNNIHPPDKQSVGARLALAAMGLVYGEQQEYMSPTFLLAAPQDSAIRVWFSHAAGLTTKGQPLSQAFEVAGSDGKFVPATAANIDGTTIVVSSSSVPEPRYVRYGWAGTVNSYIYNAAGLPAGTFTSIP